jgi:hypothetical protein
MATSVRMVWWDFRFEFLTSDIANADVDLVMLDIEISFLKGKLVNTSDKRQAIEIVKLIHTGK